MFENASFETQFSGPRQIFLAFTPKHLKGSCWACWASPSVFELHISNLRNHVKGDDLSKIKLILKYII